MNPRKDDDGSDWNWALIFIVRDESWRASMNFFILIFFNMHTTETGHQFRLMIGFDGAKVSSSYHIIACFNLKAFLCLRFAAKGTSAELRAELNYEWQTVMKKNLLGTKLCNKMSNLKLSLLGRQLTIDPAWDFPGFFCLHFITFYNLQLPPSLIPICCVWMASGWKKDIKITSQKTANLVNSIHFGVCRLSCGREKISPRIIYASTLIIRHQIWFV